MSDDIRKAIGTVFAPTHLTGEGLVTRSALVTWLQQQMAEVLPNLKRLIPPERPRPALTQDERVYLAKAIDYLRAKGGAGSGD